MSSLVDLAVSSWRPVATALALPPVPLLALGAWAFHRARRGRRGAGALAAFVAAGLWITQCDGAADLVEAALGPPPALRPAEVDALAARARLGQPIALLVLGGGVEPHAAEYDAPRLDVHAMARLEYGLWLAHRTGLPLGVTGGLGPAQADDAEAEAHVAARIVQESGGPALRWTEPVSRTTAENARLALPLLARDGIREVWIVTNAWHMPRALRDFRRAAAEAGGPPIVVQAAPIGDGSARQGPWLRWVPTGDGAWRMRALLREALGLALGA